MKRSLFAAAVRMSAVVVAIAGLIRLVSPQNANW